MVYLDKKTGLWKIGSNGKAIYNNEKQAKTAAINKIIDKIFELKRKRKIAVQ